MRRSGGLLDIGAWDRLTARLARADDGRRWWHPSHGWCRWSVVASLALVHQLTRRPDATSSGGTRQRC